MPRILPVQIQKKYQKSVRCAEEKLPLFVRPLAELEVPLLLMGSLGDGMTRGDLQQEYEAVAAETNAEICMFSQGGHPALYSNAEAAAAAVCRFMEERANH